ncbi:hypothetical protein, partial [Staphylococcus aureus]|uniref:hypothetical protein n=1 Tax=Staphylococcus aureus TaxID=1280 RepID=UPI0038B2DD17
MVNIKRALLQFFSLTFDHHEAVHYEKGNYLHQPDPDGSYYTVMEDGLGGKCETTYVVLSEPYYDTPHYNNVLNITKTRNYHNCLEEHYI